MTDPALVMEGNAYTVSCMFLLVLDSKVAVGTATVLLLPYMEDLVKLTCPFRLALPEMCVVL